jgi:hypothetical protein
MELEFVSRAGRGKAEPGFPPASRSKLFGIDPVHDFGWNQSRIFAFS